MVVEEQFDDVLPLDNLLERAQWLVGSRVYMRALAHNPSTINIDDADDNNKPPGRYLLDPLDEPTRTHGRAAVIEQGEEAHGTL